MNCSHDCKMCRVCKYIRKHFKNFIIKTLCMLNAFSLFYWMCWIDAIISWQPWVIMLVNASFLILVAYANGWVYNTGPYYERMEKEGEY